MRCGFCLSLVPAAVLAVGPTVKGGAQDYQGYILGGGAAFTSSPGVPVAIYGQHCYIISFDGKVRVTHDS